MTDKKGNEDPESLKEAMRYIIYRFGVSDEKTAELTELVRHIDTILIRGNGQMALREQVRAHNELLRKFPKVSAIEALIAAHDEGQQQRKKWKDGVRTNIILITFTILTNGVLFARSLFFSE